MGKRLAVTGISIALGVSALLNVVLLVVGNDTIMHWYALEWKPDSAKIDAIGLGVQIVAVVAATVVGFAWKNRKNAFVGRRRAETMAALIVSAERLVVGLEEEQEWFQSQEKFSRPQPMKEMVMTFINRYERAKIDFTDKELATAWKLYEYLQKWNKTVESVRDDSTREERMYAYVSAHQALDRDRFDKIDLVDPSDADKPFLMTPWLRDLRKVRDEFLKELAPYALGRGVSVR